MSTHYYTHLYTHAYISILFNNIPGTCVISVRLAMYLEIYTLSKALLSLILILWTLYYCYVYCLSSPSPYLFPGHASCCQRSDRLIHAVFTVPKRFPSGLSPLCFSSAPHSSFPRFHRCILIIRCVYTTSLRDGGARQHEDNKRSRDHSRASGIKRGES